MTTRSPSPPKPSFVYYYKDKPIALMEPEEIYERMKIEARDAREVLAAPESCLTDPVLYEKYVSHPYAREHKILTEMGFACRHQFEALDKAGRTTKNMTIQDWRKLELPFTLITVIESRDVFVMRLPYESGEIMKPKKEVIHQYKQLIHRLVDSTPCIHIQKLWMVERGSRCLEAFNLLDKALFVSALVLAMELIADSSRVCDTFKDMKEWVKNEIEKMDISLPVEVMCESLCSTTQAEGNRNLAFAAQKLSYHIVRGKGEGNQVRNANSSKPISCFVGLGPINFDMTLKLRDLNTTYTSLFLWFIMF